MTENNEKQAERALLLQAADYLSMDGAFMSLADALRAARMIRKLARGEALAQQPQGEAPQKLFGLDVVVDGSLPPGTMELRAAQAEPAPIGYINPDDFAKPTVALRRFRNSLCGISMPVYAASLQAAPSADEKCRTCGHASHPGTSCVNVAPSASAPAEQLPVELRAVAETVAKGGGFWTPCTGCYDTEDGRPTQKYTHSDVFGCELGNGCSECGGLGAVWDDTDYAEMAEFMMKDDAAPGASAQQAEPVDGCTEENCRRCRTPKELRTPDMYHAGLSAAADIADDVCAQSRNHLFRSGAKVVAGAIRSAAPHADCPAPEDDAEAAEREHMGCAHCATGIYAATAPQQAEQACPACNGAGQIATGCDEFSESICKACEGVGLAAPVLSASPTELPEGELRAEFERQHQGRNLKQHRLRGTYISAPIAALWNQHKRTAIWMQSRTMAAAVAESPAAPSAAKAVDVQWWLAELDQYGNAKLVDGQHSDRAGADKAMYLFNALGLAKDRRYAVARVELFEPKPSAEGVNHEAIAECNEARAALRSSKEGA